MSAEKSTSKVEKFYLWLKVILLVASGVFALFNQLSLLTFAVVALFIFIFLINSFYTWKVKVGEQPEIENYDNFARILLVSRKSFIAIAFAIPILCVAIDEMHTYFPHWQQTFIIEHFTKDAEVKELQPILIRIDSLSTLSNPTQQLIPTLCVNTNNSFYYYDHSKITSEMIKYADDAFDTMAIVIAVLLIVFTLFLIIADFLGSIRYKQTTKVSHG